MAFSKPLGGYRTVRILVGDTLQRIAQRELDDATLWTDLVWLNDLSAPYLVATAAEAIAQPGTLYYGQSIKVPAPAQAGSAVPDPDNLFGVDVRLHQGLFRVVNGDIDLVAGIPNLRQAIEHRLVTETGELVFHPDYGCNVRAVIGFKNSGTAGLLARWFVEKALREEPRIESVLRAGVEVSGDTISVAAEVKPVVENTPIDANLVIVE